MERRAIKLVFISNKFTFSAFRGSTHFGRIESTFTVITCFSNLVSSKKWTSGAFVSDGCGSPRMWLHDLLRHMPTGHNDLWARVRMWLHDLLRHMPTGHNDLWARVRMWLHDLFRHMPTGHNDLWARVRMWLHDLLRHMPAGHNDLWGRVRMHMPTEHNDLWACENVKVCSTKFPPWNFLQ